MPFDIRCGRRHFLFILPHLRQLNDCFDASSICLSRNQRRHCHIIIPSSAMNLLLRYWIIFYRVAPPAMRIRQILILIFLIGFHILQSGLFRRKRRLRNLIRFLFALDFVFVVLVFNFCGFEREKERQKTYWHSYLIWFVVFMTISFVFIDYWLSVCLLLLLLFPAG